MAIQPYEIANFNLIEFASIYNKFIDTNDPAEIDVQWMDKDGNFKNVKIENVASIKETIKADISDETKARIAEDQKLDQKITQTKTELSTQISDEIQNRINGDKALQSNIDNVNKTLTDSVKKVETDLNNEISRAEEAEKALDDKITKEINDRTAVDKALDDKFTKAISNETEARVAADNDLTNKISEVNQKLTDKINQEIKDRVSGDNQVLTESKTYTDNSIKNEADARVAADGTLKFNDDIKNEDGTSPNNLTDAINIVDNKIEYEVKRATQKDEDLENEIQEVSKKVEAILAGASADLDSFKELVDYINKIDAEDDEALAKFMKDTLAQFAVLFNGTGLDKEKGYIAPTQAHYINQTKSIIDALEKLDSALYVTYNNIVAEENRAKAAEGNLQFNDDIRNSDGSKPNNLTDAINDVDNKIMVKLDNEILVTKDNNPITVNNALKLDGKTADEIIKKAQSEQLIFAAKKFDVFNNGKIMAYFPLNSSPNDLGGIYSGKWYGQEKYAYGIDGKAAYFDRRNQIRVDNFNKDYDELWVSFWMYWYGSWNVMPLSFGYYDVYLNSGKIGWNTFNGELYGVELSNYNTYVRQWVHVVINFKESSYGDAIYLNGEKMQLPDVTPYLKYLNKSHATIKNKPLCISGAYPDTGYKFYGLIDNVRIFKEPLTDDEVYQLYKIRA